MLFVPLRGYMHLHGNQALGESHENLPIPMTAIKSYPFHRFHRVGIKLAVAWKQFKDNREARES